MKHLLVLVAGVVLTGLPAVSHAMDTDGDGVIDTADCAPNDANIAVAHTYYFDLDGDQYGDAANGFQLCSTTPFPGSVVWGNDPDDTDNTVVPVVAPKGNRVLALDFLDSAADGQWRIDRARELGANATTLSLDWSLLESAPGEYAGPQVPVLDIVDAAYAAEGFQLNLGINPFARHSLQLPDDLAQSVAAGTMRFNDPQLINRFLDLLTFVRSELGNVELNGLQFGFDIDLYAEVTNSPTFWSDYGEFVQAARTHSRALWDAELQVGVSATLQGLTGSESANLATLNAANDFVAISYEPRGADFSAANPAQVSNDFDQLVAVYPAKPLYFTRVSYPSSVVLGSSQTLQSQFLYAFFDAWDEYASRIPFVAFTQLHDISDGFAANQAADDPYFQSTAVDSTRIAAYLASTGMRLFAGEGASKSAYQSLRNLAFERDWWNAKQRNSRKYLMGFTPYPYDHNPGDELIDSVLDAVFSDVTGSADMVSFHFDKGVPWVEAAADDFSAAELPYSENMRMVWDQYRSRRPAATTSVAINPLGIPRTRLASYWGMGEGYYLDETFDQVGTGVVQDYEDRLLPAPWDELPLNSPEVKQAYLHYAVRAIDYFNPRYLVLGLEVNLALDDPAVFEAYVELQEFVYDAIRSDPAYDNVKIVISFAAEFLIDDEFGTPVLVDGIQDPTLKQRHLDAITALAPYTDVIGLSVYPVKMRYGAYQLPASMFDNLFDTVATVTPKPLAITEMGYPHSSFSSDVWGLPFVSDADKQARFIRLLLEEAEQNGNVEFVNGFSTRDITPYMDKLRALSLEEPPFISSDLVDFFQIFEFNGLFDSVGNPLLAGDVWLSSLGLSYAPEIVQQPPVSVSSPDGNLVADIKIDAAGNLTYELTRSGITMLTESRLGMTVDNVDLGSGVVELTSTSPVTFDSSYPTRGAKSVARNHYNEVTLTAVRQGIGDAELEIDVRLFDDGFAYRYRVPGSGLRSISGEDASWSFPVSSTVWHQVSTGNYEANYSQAVLGTFANDIGGPITVELPMGDGFVALAEAGLRNYSGMTYVSSLGSTEIKAEFLDDESWLLEAGESSPWRLAMVSADLNTLVNSDIVYNLNDDPDPLLFPKGVYTGWIKPGRAVWSWWSDFYSGYSYSTQLAYVDYADELGFEYSVVDAWWEKGFPEGDKDQFDRLADLVQYGKDSGRNVGIWVWKSWFSLSLEEDRQAFFQAVADAGAVGVKVDNVFSDDSESQANVLLHEAILRDAANHNLMINFHGVAKPTGLARTYPNEITREGFMGLELNGLAWDFGLFVKPEHNAAIPFTRFLLGPGDYTPLTFDVRKIGKTTFTHQLALAGLLNSPLQHIADNPELILEETDVLDVLKDIPTVWDETVVIDESEIGSIAGLARRSGKRWYLFVINGDELLPANLGAIDLDFLGPGEFDATLISDFRAVTFNREERSSVTATDTVSASMLAGGGYVARFTPALPSSRTTHMGFASIPVSNTRPGWDATYAAIRDNGDLITHTLQDGVPWTEALNSTDYRDYSYHLQEHWNLLKARDRTIIPNHVRYLMINPISTTYLGIAPYYGETTFMPLPPPFDQYEFDHPDVKQAMLNYMIAAVEFFEPTYLAINVEANILLAKRPDLWDGFKDLNAFLYMELKQRYPDLKVFSTIHYEHMLALHTESAQLQEDLADSYPGVLESEVRALLLNSDLMALSTYPYMVFDNPFTVGGRPNADYFDRAYAIATDMQLQLAIDQTGYITRDFYHQPTNAQLYGSEVAQQDYMRFLLGEAAENDFAFINYFVPIDYGTNYGTNPTVLTWAYAGLFTLNSQGKLALEDWNAFLNLPHQPALTGDRRAGSVQSTVIGIDKVNFALDNGFVARLEFLDEDILRVRINADRLLTSWESGAISWDESGTPGSMISEDEDNVYMITPQLSVIVQKSPFQVTTLRSDGTLISKDVELGIGYNSDTGVIYNRKEAPEGEAYLGLGLRGGPVNRRGDVFLQRNTDNFGYGEFTSPLYSSTPFFYGAQNGTFYGLFLDSPAQPFFDMDSNSDNTLLIGAYQDELDYYLFAGPGPGNVAEAFARVTGFIPLPPKWALGFHQSRYGYQSWSEIQTVGQTFRDLQIPVDAVYLDLDYMNDLDWFSWNPVEFADPVANNAQLEAIGIKRVNILDPSIQPDDPLYEFLVDSHFFLEDSFGDPVLGSIFLPFGDVSWFDYTRTDAGNFYKGKLKSFMLSGVSGIWNDINEPASNFMPQAIYDFDGQKRSDLEGRNLYALANVKWTQEAMLELRPNERPFILSRSGYAGSQRYNANWSGDSLSTFDSLRVSIQNSIHMSISGMIQFGHDIGGFLGTPDAELFTRWMQFASFNPYFRNHAVNTSELSEPWVYGEPYTTVVRDAIEGRYLLFPHLYTMVERASRTAEPVLVASYYHFPNDPETYEQDTEFMFGRHMLVAPVFESGATERTLYLPQGSDWFDMQSGERHTGGQSITVPAPLSVIPTFARAGAILVGGPLKQYVTEPVPPLVTVDLYPGSDNSYTLYEDDGISFDFQSGNYRRTPISAQYAAGLREVTIGLPTGDWVPPQRPWELYFHDMTGAPVSVSLDGVALAPAADENELDQLTEGWFYRESDAVLVVKRAQSDLATVIRVEESAIRNRGFRSALQDASGTPGPVRSNGSAVRAIDN
ncbi:MAG: TIM-barrel domain-containing protein [Gammaproteobacteria bacterium]